MQISELVWKLCQLLIIGMFVLGSAGISAAFTWSSVLPLYGWELAACSVAIMLGMECLKPIAVQAAWQHIARPSWLVIPAVLCALACVTASFLTELQVVARARAAYVATETGATKRDATWTDRRAELRRDLEALGPTRTAEELKPLVDAAALSAGDCSRIATVAQRQACAALPALQSEQARSARAASLRGSLVAMDVAAGPTRGQSAEANSLSGLLALIHVKVHPGAVDDWLALVMVVLMQTGSAFCMVVMPVAQAGPKTRENPGAAGGARGSNAPPSGGTEDHERIHAILRGSGGRATGGQRQLAETFGMGHDRKRFLRVARWMANNGTVRLRVERDGTTIELIETPP